MLDRRYLAGSLILGFALCLMGCSSPTLVSIAITPNAAYFSDAPGLTRQFTAIGTFAQGNHPKTTQDITDEVTWTSNATGVVTVSSTGLVTTTGVDYGTSDITARLNGFTGLIVANATAEVCEASQKATSTGCE
ncbi:MAG: Ig-like domain-containing protein [Acidobacteriaceae bacterium]